MLSTSHPLLYLISDRKQFISGDAWQLQLEAIAQAAQAGCQFIQIREKDLAAQDLSAFVKAAIIIARPHGTKILVNDRLDVALAASADGVHLRVTSLSVAEIRALTQPRNFLIGASTHSLLEAQRAASQRADFVVCGPVYETPSKLEYGAPFGLTGLAEVCSAVKIPVLALGGINLSNFEQPLAIGAAGIAGISLFGNPDTLVSNIKMMLSFQREPQDSV